MAVLPGGSSPVPEGGQQPNAGGLSWMQDVTEASVRQNSYNEVFPSMKSAKDSLLGSFVGGLFEGFSNVLKGLDPANWLPVSVREAAQAIRDGQLDLNDRTDLLLPFVDRGSVYMDDVSGWNNSGVMPFNKQIGPMQNLRFENNGIRLLDVGQWEIEATVTASWVRFVTSEVTWRIRVLRADGSVFSESRYTMSNANNMTMHLSTDVVVEEAGYLVQVEVQHIGVGRAILGGPSWNRLTVRHLNKKLGIGENGSGVATGNPTNPDDDIVGQGSGSDGGTESSTGE